MKSRSFCRGNRIIILSTIKVHHWERVLTKIRTTGWYEILHKLGRRFTDPKNKNKELMAP